MSVVSVSVISEVYRMHISLWMKARSRILQGYFIVFVIFIRLSTEAQEPESCLFVKSVVCDALKGAGHDTSRLEVPFGSRPSTIGLGKFTNRQSSDYKKLETLTVCPVFHYQYLVETFILSLLV